MGQRYSDEQNAFVIRLIDDEQCSYSMVTFLTGIPVGSVHRLCKRGNGHSCHKQGKAERSRCHLAYQDKKLTELKRKYTKELEKLFGKRE